MAAARKQRTDREPIRHLIPFSLSLDRVAELSAILFASWRLCVMKIVSREDAEAQREKETAFAIRRGSLARYAYTRENSTPSKPNSPKRVAVG